MQRVPDNFILLFAFMRKTTKKTRHFYGDCTFFEKICGRSWRNGESGKYIFQKKSTLVCYLFLDYMPSMTKTCADSCK